MTTTRTAAAVLMSGLALAGCASTGGSATSTATSTASAPSAASQSSAVGSSAPSSPASAPASAVAITIKDFAYTVPASVSPGATITVVNKDSEAHTVTFDAGGAVDDAAPAGSTTHFTAPAKPGRYPLHCKYHANMNAVLIVT